MSLHVVILAAGKGKRMASSLPKVLHHLGGVSLLERIIHTAIQLQPDAVHVVYGNAGDQVKQQLAHLDVNWVLQSQQLGTGHAVAQALSHLDSAQQVLVLSGDVPLVAVDTLRSLCDQTPVDHLGLLVAHFPQPTGLGRIIRDESKQITAIIEERDATEEQRAIQEIYSGIMVAPVARLQSWLPQVQNNNQQGEYYLTDVVAMAVTENRSIVGVAARSDREVRGVNDLQQLVELERFYQREQAERLLANGVLIMDPQRFDLRGNVRCASGVMIDVNVVISGDVTIGQGSVIGPNCVLHNAIIGEHVTIEANSIVTDCHIGDHCCVGPFARLRPGTQLQENARIGNFVEVKQSVIGVDSKVNHLSYIGDTLIGDHVNVGAGTITCNYDGFDKHQTHIESSVFIGSGTQLVAPIRVGSGATIGAGSTIRTDVPADALALSDSQQKTIPKWKRKKDKSSDQLS